MFDPDMDGIDVAILTPTLGLHVMAIDGVEQEHALALCRTYNDYVAEFASENPERFKIWGWLPRQAPALAAREARRYVEELGAVGVAMTNGGVDGTVLTDTAFEPLWAEVERLGVPLGLHVFGQSTFADDLRHRYASLLLQAGEPIGYVKAQLGHSSIQVTVDRYGHFIPGVNRAAVDRLAEATQGARAILHLDSTWTSGERPEGTLAERPATT